MCADFAVPPGGADMWDNEQFTADMWDDEQFTSPLGGYPTRDRPQAGFQEAERTSEQGTGAGVSSENGSVGQPSPSTATGPAPLSADDDAKLREAVMRLRWQQPEEWEIGSRVLALEKKVLDQTAIIEMLTEALLGLAKRAAV